MTNEFVIVSLEGSLLGSSVLEYKVVVKKGAICDRLGYLEMLLLLPNKKEAEKHCVVILRHKPIKREPQQLFLSRFCLETTSGIISVFQ